MLCEPEVGTVRTRVLCDKVFCDCSIDAQECTYVRLQSIHTYVHVHITYTAWAALYIIGTYVHRPHYT